MQTNTKDLSAGLFFIAVGVLYGSLAWFGLPIGRALDMGPGYFPVVLSGMLVVLGIVIVGRSFLDTQDRLPFGVVPWRGVVFLSLATITFAAFVEEIGLLPDVFAATFVATLANPKVKLVKSVLSSLCIALFCTAVFAYGIRLPIPVVGEWLSW
ncbi:tripartite tricarboxylate transporter TctB family protein [Hyphomicrobium sp.]|uniref:tripartite tricarboxylate transporter TctB family protein n=1 Tax=Hyphomicrobium sp. TaxID=82 RepID=UPI002FE0A9CE